LSAKGFEEELMHTLELTVMGHEVGVVLTQQMLTRLGVGHGDRLIATETPTGFLLRKHDAAVEQQIELGRKFAEEYRETLAELAK
jgi:hypothetical protein